MTVTMDTTTTPATMPATTTTTSTTTTKERKATTATTTTTTTAMTIMEKGGRRFRVFQRRTSAAGTVTGTVSGLVRNGQRRTGGRNGDDRRSLSKQQPLLVPPTTSSSLVVFVGVTLLLLLFQKTNTFPHHDHHDRDHPSLLNKHVVVPRFFHNNNNAFQMNSIIMQVEAVRRMPGDKLRQHYHDGGRGTLGGGVDGSDNDKDNDNDRRDRDRDRDHNYHHRQLLEYMISSHSLNNNSNSNTTSSTTASTTSSTRTTTPQYQPQKQRSLTIGKNVDVPVVTNPNDHLVDNQKLPLFGERNEKDTRHFVHWAGLLPVSDDDDKKSNYFFYWLFAPDQEQVELALQNHDDRGIQDVTDIPLVIWLNGGPACSSMDGLWLENGPLRLVQPDPNKNQYQIEVAEHSWHKAPAYVLYIDQPVGTGLSFTTSAKYPRNDEEVNIDFYYFMQQFFTLHSDKFVKSKDGSETTGRKTLSRPLYFSGESHAGHYIPSMMNYIHQQNLKLTSDGGGTGTSSPTAAAANIEIPLAGALIGNGWVDPIYQYSAQDAAYGTGLVGLAQKRNLEVEELECRKKLQQGSYVNNICFSLLDQVVDNSQGVGSNYVVSQYDSRKWEVRNKPRDFPPGHTQVENYLGGHGRSVFDGTQHTFKDVLDVIHASPSLEAGQSFRECTDPPYNALKHQDGLGVTSDVKDLLNTNSIRMLFFNGIHDLICNHVGNEEAVENIEWEYQTSYQKSERYGWKSISTGEIGGYMKEFNNLMYLKVLNAGHMVPMDVPDVSLDMLRTFIFNKSFQTYQQNISGEKTGSGDSSGAAANCPACPVCPPPPPQQQQGSGDNCPICQDCTEICDVPSSSSSSSPSTKSKSDGTILTKSEGVVWGLITFLSLSITGCIVWRFCCNGSRRARRAGYTTAQYDMEMSKTSTTANGAGGGGSFRDDADLDDDDYEDEGEYGGKFTDPPASVVRV